ncbi:MAG: hypothetical protein J0M12_06175 [Deltaproteobacteria bacterium]|nr:hypothetical protein [Deltaproteobacteria bacterium]
MSTSPSSKPHPAKNRTLQTLLGVALVCVALGIGNIIFAQFKYNQYSDLLSEANAELARPESAVSLPLMGSPLNIDKQTQHITRLKVRMDFYSLVILGGQTLVALGGIGLAACLLIGRKSEEPPTLAG